MQQIPFIHQKYTHIVIYSVVKHNNKVEKYTLNLQSTIYFIPDNRQCVRSCVVCVQMAMPGYGALVNVYLLFMMMLCI